PAVGSAALFSNDSRGNGIANGNNAFGAFALFSNIDGTHNSAFGDSALTFNTDSFNNTAVGAEALLFNDFTDDAFANNNTAVGWRALRENTDAASNTAVGSLALRFNDVSGLGAANANTAVGTPALFTNVDGSENTVVGTGAGPMIVAGFNNTYLGDFVGTVIPSPPGPDESNTIRIGDLSNGNGAGSLACYIGGIFFNFQPERSPM